MTGNGSWQALGQHSRSGNKYFVLRWEPGPNLPLSNSLISFCQNQPTSLKVNVEKKKSLCYFDQTELTWIITPPSAAGIV
jgi:hypothetical protein